MFASKLLKTAGPEAILQKIPKAPGYKLYTDYALNPANKQEIAWINDAAFDLSLGTMRRVIVPISQVVTDQETCDIGKILVYLSDPDLVFKVSPPVVVLLPNGKYMIHDGNHRILSAKLLGEEKLLMHVVDYQACLSKTAKTARPFTPEEKRLLDRAKEGDLAAFVKLYRDKIIIRKKPGNLETPCWQWAGAGDKDGYGKIKFDGVAQSPHRLVWQLLNGPITDPEMEVDHMCQTPSCFNPEHLQLVHKDHNKKLIKIRRDEKRRKMEQTQTVAAPAV